MKIIIVILFAAALLFVKPVLGQESIWKNAVHWKLYTIHSKAGFKYTTDTLQYFKNISLDDHIMQNFLDKAIIWPPEKYSLWMGLFVVSYETANKQIRKLIISSYGGFVYDPLSKRYYELPESKRADWYQYINNNAEKLELK